jgi:hypothetical protein
MSHSKVLQYHGYHSCKPKQMNKLEKSFPSNWKAVMFFRSKGWINLRYAGSIDIAVSSRKHFYIFAVDSGTSLAGTIAVISSAMSRCVLNSTTSLATTLPRRLWRMLGTSRKERPPGSMRRSRSKCTIIDYTSIAMDTTFTPSPSFCQRTY